MAAGTTANERAALLDSLPSEATMRQQFQRALDTERAFGIASFNDLPGSRYLHLRGELAALLDTFSEFESYAAQTAGLASPQPATQSLFGNLSWQAQRQSLVAFRRNQALTRAVQIFAKWQDIGKQTEVNLSNLGLPEPMTQDPFTGSTMHFQIVEKTITIYSAGENLADDGGDSVQGQDVEVQTAQVH